MHSHTLENWQHSHDFIVIQEKGEKRTLQVLLLTAVTMVVEIAAGKIFGSMALLADGWHMGTHVAAFTITIFAYRYAERHATNPSFSFGTGKVSVLGGFASAVALAVVAFIMAMESINRLFNPHEIHFNQAIAVAVLGLIINLISAYLLRDNHSHDHSHNHDHTHHHDHNLKAAYFHVLADALTSVLAIIALFTGKYIGWNWMDPVMGIVGALIIAHWSYGLVRETSSILLDQNIDGEQEKEIREKIEADSDNLISDIHIWKLGGADYAAVISIVTHYPKAPEYYKELLADCYISHVTVEVNSCDGDSCTATGR